MNKEISAQVIGHITVKDTEKWTEYRSQVGATMAPWGAELVCRGKRTDILCGEHHHTDIVFIRFPNVESAKNWFNSQAYQALRAAKGISFYLFRMKRFLFARDIQALFRFFP